MEGQKKWQYQDLNPSHLVRSPLHTFESSHESELMRMSGREQNRSHISTELAAERDIWSFWAGKANYTVVLGAHKQGHRCVVRQQLASQLSFGYRWGSKRQSQGIKHPPLDSSNPPPLQDHCWEGKGRISGPQSWVQPLSVGSDGEAHGLGGPGIGLSSCARSGSREQKCEAQLLAYQGTKLTRGWPPPLVTPLNAFQRKLGPSQFLF